LSLNGGSSESQAVDTPVVPADDQAIAPHPLIAADDDGNIAVTIPEQLWNILEGAVSSASAYDPILALILLLVFLLTVLAVIAWTIVKAVGCITSSSEKKTFEETRYKKEKK
jgi:hypothetical protein